MTQYFEDWSLDTLNAVPNASRWTSFGFAATSGYWTGKVQDIGSGVRAVQPRDTGWGPATVGYNRAELGTYAPDGSETIEMTMLFRFPGGQGTWAGGLRFGNYWFQPQSATVWELTRGGYPGFTDGINGAHSGSFACAANTKYWARVRRTGAGVYSLRLWEYGASEDTGAWLVTSDADTTTATGIVGFYAYEPSYGFTIDIIAFGIGTAGDAAPTTGGPPPVTPVLMGQIVM